MKQNFKQIKIIEISKKYLANGNTMNINISMKLYKNLQDFQG